MISLLGFSSPRWLVRGSASSPRFLMETAREPGLLMTDGLMCVSGPTSSRNHRPSLLYLFLFLSWKRGAYFFKVLWDSSKAQAQGGRRGNLPGQPAFELRTLCPWMRVRSCLGQNRERKDQNFSIPKQLPPLHPVQEDSPGAACPGPAMWLSGLQPNGT